MVDILGRSEGAKDDPAEEEGSKDSRAVGGSEGDADELGEVKAQFLRWRRTGASYFYELHPLIIRCKIKKF